MDQLLPILLVILAIVVLWTLLKFVAKLGIKIFTCGIVLIIIIGLVIFILNLMDILSF